MLQILVTGLLISKLELLAGVFLDEDLFCILLVLVASDGLVCGLRPDPEPAVQAAGQEVVGSLGDNQSPDFQHILIQILNELIGIQIPEFKMSVFAPRDRVVGAFAETHRGDRLRVCEDRLYAMSEIQVPHSDVFVHAR